MRKWKDKVRDVYGSLEELQSYDRHYSIAKRCGYSDCQSLWEANPVICGSVNPSDFGRA
jgi:hypothetical protein